MKIKDFRLILLIVLIFVSLIVVIYPKFSQGTGVIVTSVEKDTPCKDVITVGSIITKITDKSINNRNDFIQFSKSLKGPITLIINDNPRSCIIPENSTLNVDVKNIGGDRKSVV